MVTCDRKACTLAPNVLSAQCPTRQALDLIADKWTTLLIYLLSKGKQRYGDLHRQVGGISQKMLTQTLRKLERDGLVTRHVYPEVPPRTEYELTQAGAHAHRAPGRSLRVGWHASARSWSRPASAIDHLQKKPSLSA